MSMFIGTAGWNVPSNLAAKFASAGTHLKRYAAVMNAVEINSTFYRSHRPETYERWSRQTPEHFRFAVKLPKQVTHANRLLDTDRLLTIFLHETSQLGAKRGPILVQLPPSLHYDAACAERFFGSFREQTTLPIVCEPRHESWFRSDADKLLCQYQIGRVAADPSIIGSAAEPAGAMQTCYFRWHGSPRRYYSSYDQQSLIRFVKRAEKYRPWAEQVWCIFDNTAVGAALQNAIDFCHASILRSTGATSAS